MTVGSMMYDDQRPVSANYDNPQSPKFSDRKMTEAAYNASLPNHPLNLEVGQQLQRATSNGDQHSIDPFDMGKWRRLFLIYSLYSNFIDASGNTVPKRFVRMF